VSDLPLNYREIPVYVKAISAAAWEKHVRFVPQRLSTQKINSF
jgi:hypothetical protein